MHVKDYLECKFQPIGSPALLKIQILFTSDSSYFLHSNSGEKCVKRNTYLFNIERVKLKKQVNTVHVRDQKHELTPPRDRYPCDNGYKEVTAFPPRNIVYDQDIQLIGLRDKPITQQDALPKSYPTEISTKAGPVVPIRGIPFVILFGQNIEASA
ncbi:hypothetical protein GQ457_12G014650 [Hibiscus cannabinus]